MRRKETYATTGPRIKLRFFASADFSRNIENRTDMVKRAYKEGVSMGGDLIVKGDARRSFSSGQCAMQNPTVCSACKLSKVG